MTTSNKMTTSNSNYEQTFWILYTKTVPRNADDLLHALPHTITYTYCTNMELVQEGARVRNSSDTAYTLTFAGLNFYGCRVVVWLAT